MKTKNENSSTKSSFRKGQLLHIDKYITGPTCGWYTGQAKYIRMATAIENDFLDGRKPGLRTAAALSRTKIKFALVYINDKYPECFFPVENCKLLA